ncbi:MAG: DUF3299 domain-containing protein [Pseudomonadota bacterium]
MTHESVSRFLVAMAAVLLSISARAGGETLAWKDLLPSKQLQLEEMLLAKQSRLWKFEDAMREGYYDVAYEMSIKAGLEDGSIKPSELAEGDRKILEQKPSTQYPAAVPYWQAIEALRKKLEASEQEVAAGLSGRRVRLPGYVLPLEFSGDSVTEFLLVPFVGACIHVPPPPPNQIVHVRPDKPFVSEGLYAPVWIEGVMQTEAASHDLTLVDGSAPIDVGYTMGSAAVTKYEQKK